MAASGHAKAARRRLRARPPKQPGGYLLYVRSNSPRVKASRRWSRAIGPCGGMAGLANRAHFPYRTNDEHVNGREHRPMAVPRSQRLLRVVRTAGKSRPARQADHRRAELTD